MNARAFADHVSRILQADRAVGSALGQITTRLTEPYFGLNPRTGESIPVPSKRAPRFTPSEQLLVAAFGDDRVPHADVMRGPPAPGTVYVHDLEAAADQREGSLHSGDSPIGDQLPARPIETIDVGELFDEAVAALRAAKVLTISGFGKLAGRRLKKRRLDLPTELRRADDHLAGKQIAFVVFSHMLNAALNKTY